MLKVGTGRVDITPEVGGWMDGLQREHGSESIHDRLSARALAFDEGKIRAVIVSAEIIGLSTELVDKIRRDAQKRTGIPAENIFLACSHSHSGPAVIGYFSPRDEKYLAELPAKFLEVIEQASGEMVAVKVGMGQGEEISISHYRRLWNKAGKIVMNWEPVAPESIVGPAGEPDHEVGVLKLVSVDTENKVVAQLFHYTTHPNVLSGESFMISAEFPGLAAKIIEEEVGGSALYLNGAQGSSDIDGLKDRDWEGVERTGKALAKAVLETSEKIQDFQAEVKLATVVRRVEVPVRCVSDDEVNWAKKVLAEATGEPVTLIDGVTDEFKAELIIRLLPKRGEKLSLELSGLAIGEMALLAFPGELFTEIGAAIKKASPFKQTYIMGLTNGKNGYFPSTKAIGEGGYSVETRRVDPPSEEIITEAYLDLLRELSEKVR